MQALGKGGYLANHKPSASHNGVTASNAFLIPRANALTSEHTISRSRSSHARLCARNSNNSTSPVLIEECRDLTSVSTVIDDSLLVPSKCFALSLYVFQSEISSEHLN